MRRRCVPSTTRARLGSKTPGLSISPSARKRARRCAGNGSCTDLGSRSRSTTPPTATSAPPLRGYVRRLTEEGQTEVVLVMPELVVRGLSRALHNQRALYLKRLLMFEPRVIFASVPYQLMR